MITVTDEAKVLLDGILNKRVDGEHNKGARGDRCLRVVSRSEVVGVDIDAPRDGDRVVDHDGRPLLLISPDIDRALDGATIGARHSAGGDKLILSRRKAG